MLLKETNHFIDSFQQYATLYASKLLETDYAVFQHQVFIPCETSFLQYLLLLITSEDVIELVELSSGEHKFIEVLMELQLGV